MKKFSLRLWPRSTEQHEQLGPEEPSVIDGFTLGDENKKFGIRSYLHQFYLSSPTIEELENPGNWYLLPPSRMQRTSNYLCRVFTLIGLLLLMAGAALIIIGYTWKPSSDDLDTEITQIAITQDDDGDFYINKDRLNELLHQNDKLKVSGFIVFGLGALIISLSLVVPTCLHFFSRRIDGKLLPFSEDNTPNDPPIKIYPSMGSRFKVTPTKPTRPQKISPTSGPVSIIMQEISVQPGNSKRSVGNSPSADDLLMASDSDALLP